MIEISDLLKLYQPVVDLLNREQSVCDDDRAEIVIRKMRKGTFATINYKISDGVLGYWCSFDANLFGIWMDGWASDSHNFILSDLTESRDIAIELLEIGEVNLNIDYLVSPEGFFINVSDWDEGWKRIRSIRNERISDSLKELLEFVKEKCK